MSKKKTPGVSFDWVLAQSAEQYKLKGATFGQWFDSIIIVQPIADGLILRYGTPEKIKAVLKNLWSIGDIEHEK